MYKKKYLKYKKKYLAAKKYLEENERDQIPDEIPDYLRINRQ